MQQNKISTPEEVRGRYTELDTLVKAHASVHNQKIAEAVFDAKPVEKPMLYLVKQSSANSISSVAEKQIKPKSRMQQPKISKVPSDSSLSGKSTDSTRFKPPHASKLPLPLERSYSDITNIKQPSMIRGKIAKPSLLSNPPTNYQQSHEDLFRPQMVCKQNSDDFARKLKVAMNNNSPAAAANQTQTQRKWNQAR